MTFFKGNIRRYRDYLRCLLDAEPHANPENVHELLRC